MQFTRLDIAELPRSLKGPEVPISNYARARIAALAGRSSKFKAVSFLYELDPVADERSYRDQILLRACRLLPTQ